VGLAVLFEILTIINSAIFMRLPEDVPWRVTVLPFYGIFMMLCGLAAGIVALVAVLRQHERSWLVWLALGIGLTALVFVLGEFIIPH
jgi:peptidoglycan/LPS O-acetylase OafA/YrhL